MKCDDAVTKVPVFRLAGGATFKTCSVKQIAGASVDVLLHLADTTCTFFHVGENELRTANDVRSPRIFRGQQLQIDQSDCPVVRVSEDDWIKLHPLVGQVLFVMGVVHPPEPAYTALVRAADAEIAKRSHG